jgi:uncharacterized protein YeaO (DUF488 family)
VGAILLSRVYDREPRPTGAVYLVERLWPRGMRRDQLALDGWLKDAAPSTELRQWFGHDPRKWAEFRRRYVVELDLHRQSWQPLLAGVDGDVILLYSSRDREHNNAVALRDYLLAHERRTP